MFLETYIVIKKKDKYKNPKEENHYSCKSSMRTHIRNYTLKHLFRYSKVFQSHVTLGLPTHQQDAMRPMEGTEFILACSNN